MVSVRMATGRTSGPLRHPSSPAPTASTSGRHVKIARRRRHSARNLDQNELDAGGIAFRLITFVVFDVLPAARREPIEPTRPG